MININVILNIQLNRAQILRDLYRGEQVKNFNGYVHENIESLPFDKQWELPDSDFTVGKIDLL